MLEPSLVIVVFILIFILNSIIALGLQFVLGAFGVKMNFWVLFVAVFVIKMVLPSSNSK